MPAKQESIADYRHDATRNDAPAPGMEDEFGRLSREWRTGRPHGADVAQMIKHPAYECIIKMGPTAIPIILQELDREVDHWFPALHVLTGVDPSRRTTRAISPPWQKHG